MKHRKYTIGDDLKAASGRVLFDFFAEMIEKFLDENKLDKREKRNMGFTFSFPVVQDSIDSGECCVRTRMLFSFSPFLVSRSLFPYFLVSMIVFLFLSLSSF